MTRRSRTHPDDGLLEELGAVVFDSEFADGPVFIYVGTTGDLDITTAKDTRVTLPNVAAGAFLPVLVKQVHAAATTIAVGQLKYGR